jgi:uncharacterized protein (DUF1684 family)
MKSIIKLLGIAIFSFVLSVPAQSQDDECKTRNQNFRSGRDAIIAIDEDKPFAAADIASFKGLFYYPIDCKAVFNGKLHKLDPMKVISVETSKGGTVSVYDYGIVDVNIGGEDYSLRVYQNIDIPDFAGAETVFIPIKDNSSGNTTFDNGRYLIIQPPASGKKVVLDFNMATNPWENYNSSYSTILVPAENVIMAPVATGERKYEDR